VETPIAIDAIAKIAAAFVLVLVAAVIPVSCDVRQRIRLMPDGWLDPCTWLWQFMQLPLSW
jgi:hypothetical protein